MRAILSLMKVPGINDLWRLYLSTCDDDVRFHDVAIPADHVPTTVEQFNQAETIREFDFGRKMASRGERDPRAMRPLRTPSQSDSVSVDA